MLDKIFSGGVDISRVNPFGLLILAVGIALCMTAGRNRTPIKLIGLVICAGGALLAILG